MSFNVDAFRAEGLKFDGARPSLFEIRVNFPALADTNNVSRRLRFLAQAASLPESTIDDIQVPYFGRTIKVEGNRSFADWTIEVLNDEDFNVKAALEAWSNGMNTHISNRKDQRFDGLLYKSSATVYQHAKTGNGGNDIENAIRAYTFSGLWPKFVAGIPLNWGAVNQVETFSVTFAYDYWIPGTDENNTSATGKYNGIDGSAISWNPTLPNDTLV